MRFHNEIRSETKKRPDVHPVIFPNPKYAPEVCVAITGSLSIHLTIQEADDLGCRLIETVALIKTEYPRAALPEGDTA